MKKKHVWTTLLSFVATIVVVMAFFTMNVSAADIQAVGSCGEAISWELDTDGVLTISGTGAIEDATWSNKYENYIKSVVISDGVTSIGNGAFSGCVNLEQIEIPDSVTSIGAGAFANCTSLETIDIPDSVTTIGMAAFTASGVKNVTLPDNLTVASSNLFSGCQSLEYVYIPDSVTTFETSVFAGSSIQSVRLPAGLTEIPESMFANCRLVSVEFPANITSIGRNAFYNCHFVSLTIPEGVTSIGENAFSDCASMTSIVLPNTLTNIGAYAFSGCRNLETVTIPGSVEDIGNYAFYQCYGLKSVTILEGNQKTNIGDYCFQYCDSLKSITIPSNVEYIGSNAFEGCTRCEAVYCYANPANLFWYDVGSDDFKPGKATICYVPTYPVDYLSTYKEKFASGKAGDINVTFVGDHADMGIGDVLRGYSLSLEGDIGVNFYIHFDDVDALSSSAKMVFTISSIDGTDSRTQEVYVKPQSDASLPCATQNNGYYVFKCVVKSKEMTSTITAQIVDGDEKGTAYSYSVQEYAQYMLLHPDHYKKEIPLIKAMLNYGANCQQYFGYNTQKLANGILLTSEQGGIPLDPQTIQAAASHDDLVIEGTEIKLSRVSMQLKTKFSMKLFFTGADENTVFKYGDTVLTPVKRDNYYVVTIENFEAQYIDSRFAVKVYQGDTYLGTVYYSPIYYCKNILAEEYSETYSYYLKCLISSMIVYNEAAKAYGA